MQSGGTITRPPYVTVKMVAATIALQSDKKETGFSSLNFLGYIA